MNCDKCPNRLNDVCCHQTIKPVIKPSPTIAVSSDLVERLKAQYDAAYSYYGKVYSFNGRAGKRVSK